MDFVEVDLLKTAVSFEQYPDTLVPEIARMLENPL